MTEERNARELIEGITQLTPGEVQFVRGLIAGLKESEERKEVQKESKGEKRK